VTAFVIPRVSGDLHAVEEAYASSVLEFHA
jgi:hypothetical protein